MAAAETTNATKANLPAELKWPTASAVAARLGCSRQQVYKLEKRGKLRGQDVRSPNGATFRRYDPEMAEQLAQADELETLLVELPEGDDDDEAGGQPPNAMKLASKVVADARQMALDARRGQHEAYDLVATPAREYTKLLMAALEQREKRIAELEEKLNKFYDEQRDARAEAQEAEFLRSRLARADERKDQFFKMFSDNVPIVLDQLKASVAAGAGPFVEWMKKRSPEQQKKMIMAIEAVIGEDPPGESSAEKDQDGKASA